MVLKGSSACVVYTSKKCINKAGQTDKKTAAITGCLIMRQFVAEPYSSLFFIKSTVISQCPQWNSCYRFFNLKIKLKCYK